MKNVNRKPGPRDREYKYATHTGQRCYLDGTSSLTLGQKMNITDETLIIREEKVRRSSVEAKLYLALG